MRPGLWKGIGGCALTLSCCVAQADDGTSALLQFAEKYHRQGDVQTEQKPAASTEDMTSRSQVSRKKTAAIICESEYSEGKALTRRQNLLEQEQSSERQRVELDALRQVVARLRAEKRAMPVVAKSVLPEPRLLQQWAENLGRAWRGTPDEQRSISLLKQAKKDVAQVKLDTVLARKQTDVFREQAHHAKKELEQLQQKSQQEQGVLRSAAQVREQKIAGQQEQMLKVQNELQDFRKRQQWILTPEQLKADDQSRLSYAVGSALGSDIQTLSDERKSWGIQVDQNSLMAGINDSISGHLLVPQEDLNKLKAQADAAASTAREKLANAQQHRGEEYISKFSKQKGVKKSSMGFWYVVDYAGEGEVPGDAIIDVVVKETLIDGTVIQDMGLSGNVLSQLLSDYPPLFREAIGHLQNHGAITMVVPPELAYGKIGYPPKVPPNAAMIYELRIDNVSNG